jgi:hypothetical protein
VPAGETGPGSDPDPDPEADHHLTIALTHDHVPITPTHDSVLPASYDIGTAAHRARE